MTGRSAPLVRQTGRLDSWRLVMLCCGLVWSGCGRIGFTADCEAVCGADTECLSMCEEEGPANDPRDPPNPACVGEGAFIVNSGAEPDGENRIVVDELFSTCIFSFVVVGGGGGSPRAGHRGGDGGLNSFDFEPGEPGVIRIVVGGGGGLALDNHGGPGGGASSVVFDPDADPTDADAYRVAIAGGGGGAGRGGNGGHGGGSGGGGDAEGGARGAPGDSTGGSSNGATGGSCPIGCLWGGGGGTSDGPFGLVEGGFGKGMSPGASYSFGGGGGGGFGGGGAPRYGASGGGGGGRVFRAWPPAAIINTTDSTVRDPVHGGIGGELGVAPGQDGSVSYLIWDQ